MGILIRTRTFTIRNRTTSSSIIIGGSTTTTNPPPPTKVGMAGAMVVGTGTLTLVLRLIRTVTIILLIITRITTP